MARLTTVKTGNWVTIIPPRLRLKFDVFDVVTSTMVIKRIVGVKTGVRGRLMPRLMLVRATCVLKDRLWKGILSLL